jgi:hypothetical protein
MSPPLKKVISASPAIVYIADPGIATVFGKGIVSFLATIAGTVAVLRATEFDLTEFFIELERILVTVTT